MSKLIAWISLLLVAAPTAFAFPGKTVATANVQARLESEVDSIAPGEKFTVALVLDVRKGWHTYWRNPGDSGRPTEISWTLPPGFTAGGIEWPAPHRFVLAPLVNYGYEGLAVHLVQMTAPRDLRPGSTARLRAHADWLVCSNLCIPEQADLDLSLPVRARASSVDPRSERLFAAARAALPEPAPAGASATVSAGQLSLRFGRGWEQALDSAHALLFVPYADEVIAYGAPQTLRRDGATVTLTIKAGDQPPRSGMLEGVLIVGGAAADGTATGGETVAPRAYVVSARLTATATAAPEAAALAGAASGGSERRPAEGGLGAFAAWVGLALLGGMVLNLMPCVLPVLSIKAIGLAEQAKKHPREVRLKGLAFAAGVIVSMLALSALLLALRAAGAQIGWGFQLQSPLFVTLMAYLLFAIGLNLSGVFEVGSGLSGLGEGLTRGETRSAAFFTGVLTTLVATPCTAPFMAAAVGAALSEPPVVALSIFASLGVGLSLPLVLLSFAPWLRRALPKPGAWMDTLKQALAFPMYASAAWLVWVLTQQTASLGLAAALAGLVLVALAAWLYRKSHGRSRRHRTVAAAAAAASLALAIGLPIELQGAPAPAAGPPGAASSRWEPYDPARLAALRAAGKPVLVDFTASWCLTCLVNERTALADPAVRAIFRDKGVTLVRGDWTNGDPRITRVLAHYGRAGVPLYLLFNAAPGSSHAVILPQLLTAGAIERAFSALPDRPGGLAGR
ncbi:MAG: thioredoxin family protein [Gammaproteobacteria bacterium]|nr:thioredoxin family protein [Gammaproteobacteria bacterium]